MTWLASPPGRVLPCPVPPAARVARPAGALDQTLADRPRHANSGPRIARPSRLAVHRVAFRRRAGPDRGWTAPAWLPEPPGPRPGLGGLSPALRWPPCPCPASSTRRISAVLVAVPPVDHARQAALRRPGTGRSRVPPAPSRTAPGRSLIGHAAWNFSLTTTGPSPSIWMGTTPHRPHAALGPSAPSRAGQAAAAAVRAGPAPRPRRTGSTAPATRSGAHGTRPGAGRRVPAALRRSPDRRSRASSLASATVERGVPVIRRGFGADGGAAGLDRQLDALPPVRLARIALRATPPRLPGSPCWSSFSILLSLARRVLTESFLHVGPPALEDDVHAGNPLRLDHALRHPPGRPGLRPHIRLRRGSQPCRHYCPSPAPGDIRIPRWGRTYF